MGFRTGADSVHTSRTMMLGELSQVLDRVGAEAPPVSYLSAIIDENVLGKPTRSTRLLTAKRLVRLYALDPGCPLFRLLRHFWGAGAESRPMLAFLLAAARDPLLRDCTTFVLSFPRDQVITPGEIAAHLAERYPARFRATTLRSTARNLASTWTQAGYLEGVTKKRRAHPRMTPAVAAYALLLGYLGGLRGQRLLDCAWTRLLDRPMVELANLAAEASKQGWLRFRSSGSVVEVTFPGLLTPAEEQASREQD